ncbi:hypothetical protein [Streptomyces sp. NPDC089919]|uniref:hypothetical protein n=1 Tax=Streptomyces sp. NPDC089919 TaxID=3155188 RepID=UPI00343BE7CA
MTTTTTPLTTTARAWTRAAAAAAVLLLGATPAGAQPPPATGTFSYHSPESGDLEINHPDDGECRLLLQGADSATNHTNRKATLYSDRGCETPTATLLPGQHRTYRAPLPHSVTFT